MRILELHTPYFRERWRAEGHDVRCWGPYPHCDLRQTAPALPLADVLGTLPAGWTPDLILFGDDCRLLAVLGLEDAPCPTAMLSIDAHHHAAWHAPMAAAFDAAFVAQRDYLPAYRAAGATRARWLPCWAPDGLPEPAPEKRYAVSFVGTLDPRLNAARVALVEALQPRLPLHVAAGDYVPVFTRSRIVLNQTVKGDLNARVFEAMACGAMLLTERTGNGLLDLFREGEDLVTYPRGDVEAVVAAARRYLAAGDERAAIAERGRTRVRAAHLESHRARELLAGVAAARVPYAAAVRDAGAARAYAMLADYAGRLERRFGGSMYPALRQRYLAAAAGLVVRHHVAETDRRAVLGIVALERGQLAAALEHLAWAAAHGTRVEDHVLTVEAALRAGDARRAREAVARLRAAHPAYEIGDALAASVGLLAEAIDTFVSAR
jgi:hypothetical protein